MTHTEYSRHCIEKGHFRLAKALVKSAQETARWANISETIGNTFLEGLIATGHFYLGCIGAESNQPIDSQSSFTSLQAMVGINKDICKADELLPARALYGMGIGSMVKPHGLTAQAMNRALLDAQTYFLQGIYIAKQLQKFDPVDYPSSYIDLGLAYWLSERYDDARKILEEGHRTLADTLDYSDTLYL